MAKAKTITKARRRPQPAKLRRSELPLVHGVLASGFADHPNWHRWPTIPADEIVYINDLTPAQAKRLKTMTTAQLKALAKRQAKERARKAVAS
jgi:hypothetical protein